MSSGLTLFQSAEIYYFQGDIQRMLDLYQQAIKKILQDENVTGIFPLLVSSDSFPRETLGVCWHNFVGLFWDPAMSFTEQSDLEAFKLLNSFRPCTIISLLPLQTPSPGFRFRIIVTVYPIFSFNFDNGNSDAVKEFRYSIGYIRMSSLASCLKSAL
jgi:hypothetical protein